MSLSKSGRRDGWKHADTAVHYSSIASVNESGSL
jgi:hypothetical protein